MLTYELSSVKLYVRTIYFKIAPIAHRAPNYSHYRIVFINNLRAGWPAAALRSITPAPILLHRKASSTTQHGCIAGTFSHSTPKIFKNLIVGP